MVSGIAPTADPSMSSLPGYHSRVTPNPLPQTPPTLVNIPQVLQARMFAYPDAARYRLGTNYQQLPCNRPVAPVYCPYERDGLATINGNYGGDPNYVQSALKPVAFRSTPQRAEAVSSTSATAPSDAKHNVWTAGAVADYASAVTDEDFVQARMFWENVLGKQEGQQERLVSNVAADIVKAKPAVWQATFCASRSTLPVVVGVDPGSWRLGAGLRRRGWWLVWTPMLTNVLQTCSPALPRNWESLFAMLSFGKARNRQVRCRVESELLNHVSTSSFLNPLIGVYTKLLYIYQVLKSLTRHAYTAGIPYFLVDMVVCGSQASQCRL